MRPWISLVLLLGALPLSAPAAATAGDDLLTADALAECATMVARLRSESERLNATAAEHEQRREQLEARRQRLHDSEGRRRYNEAARAFNEDVADFEEALQEVNAMRDRYSERCAKRDYRREDLEALPEALREAMRRGLDDVSVPYTADGSANDGSAR